MLSSSLRAGPDKSRSPSFWPRYEEHVGGEAIGPDCGTRYRLAVFRGGAMLEIGALDFLEPN